MIRMKPGILFFDTKTVRRKVNAAKRQVLSKFGAFVRQTAKHSIRKRQKPSPPGSPPSSHTGLLRRFIWFGYDPAKESVVIGPARLTANGRGEAPSLLEYGGVGKTGKKKARFKARPFMGPAFEKEQDKLPALWAGSVK